MKPLGKYPRGVRVSFDAIGVNGVRERIVESRPYWTLGGVFVLVLLSLFTIACACGLCHEIAVVRLSHIECRSFCTCIGSAWPLMILVLLVFLGLTLWVAFSCTRLRIVGDVGIYTEGVGCLGSRREFTLGRDTKVKIELFKDEMCGCHGSCRRLVWARQIVVQNGRYSAVRFGKRLTDDVRDYIYACLERVVAGEPLTDAGVDTGSRQIKSVFLFVLGLVLTGALLAVSVSGFERFAVNEGVLTVTKSNWWGIKSQTTRVPCGEIAAVVAADEDRRHHDNAWVVEFKDGEGRVLARTKPLGVRILSWREELATAVKSDESYGAFHLTRLGFLLLLLVPALLFVFATNPIEFQTPAELDDFQPPSEKTFDTTCWKKKSSVRASRSGRKA